MCLSQSCQWPGIQRGEVWCSGLWWLRMAWAARWWRLCRHLSLTQVSSDIWFRQSQFILVVNGSVNGFLLLLIFNMRHVLSISLSRQHLPHTGYHIFLCLQLQLYHRIFHGPRPSFQSSSGIFVHGSLLLSLDCARDGIGHRKYRDGRTKYKRRKVNFESVPLSLAWPF